MEKCHLLTLNPSTLAYQQASSSDAFAEAQAQARQCENEAYDRATSKVRPFKI